MSLKQFNFTYFQNEDRILFRCNTMDHSEYKLWLTRRVVHFVLMIVDQYIEKQFQNQVSSIQGVISESQQVDNQISSFNQPFEQGKKYPMGSEPVLVTDVKCEFMRIEETDVFSIDFILLGGSSANLKLPMQIMKNIILILEEQNIQAHWGSPANTFQA